MRTSCPLHAECAIILASRARQGKIMRRASRLLPLMLLALVPVAGAAFMPGAVPEKELAGMERIGVVSAFGDTFHGILIGTTVFQNKNYTVEVPDWKIDEHVRSHVAKALEERGRVKALDLALDAGQVNALYRDKKPDALDESKLLELAKAQGWSHVLVLHRVRYDNAPFHQGGFGVFSRSMFGAQVRCAYALYMASVYRVDTGKNLAFRWGEPCLGGDQTLVAKPAFDDYTADEKRYIEESIKSQLARQLDTILGKLKLVK